MYLPKIGILHEQAKIAKIKNVTQQAPTDKKQHLVTAVYMRYARVLKYKIKDIDTGKTEEITTTPEHKFYETTYKKFMPISKLGSYNTITNASNHHLKIICTNNRQNNCGTVPLNSLQKVYNMQVEKAHNYFVGNMGALVHNGCDYYKCLTCDQTEINKDDFTSECIKAIDKKHKIIGIYKCKICNLTLNRNSEMADHIKTHSKIVYRRPKVANKPISCPLCNEKFDNFYLMAEHSASHAEENEKIFCDKCQKDIPLVDKLTRRHKHEQYYMPFPSVVADDGISKSSIRLCEMLGYKDNTKDTID